jgi:hypothetical protein
MNPARGRNNPFVWTNLPRLSEIRRQEVSNSVLPGGHGEREPPDTIPNSEVKPFSADDSVGDPMRK